MSDDSDTSDTGVRTVGVSVSRDTGTKVDLILRVAGLRKKRNLFASLVSAFKKPSDPSRLCSNATFSCFTLTSSSLQLTVSVQSERKRKRKKGNTNRVDVYSCSIRKFPTSVNPDSAEFEVMEPSSGNCFILMTFIKTDNLSTNWKDFQDSNGTIDVSTI